MHTYRITHSTVAGPLTPDRTHTLRTTATARQVARHYADGELTVYRDGSVVVTGTHYAVRVTPITNHTR